MKSDPSRLLSAIGQHRSLIPKSKGKRAKRKQSEVDALRIETPEVPEVPQVMKSITVGLNSTTRILENQISSPTSDPLKAIFLTQPFSSLQYAHLPLLCATSSPPVLLIPLQPASERALCGALGLPRVGIVGVKDGAEGAEAIWEECRDVEVVKMPAVKEVKTGKWMGTRIDVGNGMII